MCGVGQERLGPSYVFISLVLGPPNSLLWYVPSSRYTWSCAPILFPQEQIKDIIIILSGSFQTNCRTLALSHLEPGRTPTEGGESMTAGLQDPGCIEGEVCVYYLYCSTYYKVPGSKKE